MKSNGIVNILFDNCDDLLFTEKNWSLCHEIFPGSAAISLNNHKKKLSTNESLIVRDVPSSLAENQILSDIRTSYPDVLEVKRFVKNGSYSLPVVKITASSDTCTQLLSNGFSVHGLFFRPDRFINVNKPHLCYNCWNFGHLARSCKKETVCKKCSQTGHKVDVCVNAEFCVNCRGHHSADCKQCPKFQAVLAKINDVNL